MGIMSRRRSSRIDLVYVLKSDTCCQTAFEELKCSSLENNGLIRIVKIDKATQKNSKETPNLVKQIVLSSKKVDQMHLQSTVIYCWNEAQ